ncbi:hypothetical protein GGU10DRAFT_336699 [Lentinula aff. detonsa]|uniref:Uncharacterized protein n=1 Tax=Lentinula aff. detonsa TaxID=2804958 RepID=A0AA38NJ78_9AGAR|nr:hypothetical protein GGU10DRAFT_336699 [Lentinula aff. detonsa]
MPLSKEIRLPSEMLHVIDHKAITPSSGPIRAQKHLNRASPYSSPSPEPQRAQYHSPLSLSLSIESLSSELEYDSEREQLAHSQTSQRRPHEYTADIFPTPTSMGTPCISKPSSSRYRDADTDTSPTSTNGFIDREQRAGSCKTVRFSAEPAEPAEHARKRGPPALVFEDDSDDDFLIPKPPGEAGRPGRGGYSLFDILSWPKKKYDKVKKHINKLVEDHLDCELPMSEQSAANMKKVRQQAVEKFVFLKEYSGLWAVDDFIRNHLKYQKSVLKREKLETIAAENHPVVEKTKPRHASSGK